MASDNEEKKGYGAGVEVPLDVAIVSELIADALAMRLVLAQLVVRHLATASAFGGPIADVFFAW